MDEQTDTWPPPPTTEAPTPIFHPVATWESVCGVCSMIFAMLGAVSLGIAASEVFTVRFELYRPSLLRDGEVLLVSAVADILLVACGLASGVMGRRSSQGRTGVTVTVIVIAFGFVAYMIARVAR